MSNVNLGPRPNPTRPRPKAERQGDERPITPKQWRARDRAAYQKYLSEMDRWGSGRAHAITFKQWKAEHDHNLHLKFQAEINGPNNRGGENPTFEQWVAHKGLVAWGLSAAPPDRHRDVFEAPRLGIGRAIRR